MKLEGKVALITGAGRGIGSVAAEAFAREGANLVLNYGRAREGAEKLATKVRGLGVDAITIQADVSKPDEVQIDGQNGLGQVRKNRHPLQQRRRPTQSPA